MKNPNHYIVGLLISSFFLAPLSINAEVVREVRTPREPREARHSDGEIIVKMKGDRTFTRIQNTDGEPIEALLSRYRSRKDVAYAEPNYVAYAYATPNDPLFSVQWNFDNTTYGGVHAKTAWNVSTGQGVTVAVIDTGVAYENYTQNALKKYYKAPDFEGTTFVGGYDFVSDDTHANDENGHGTHVAGTIAQSTGNGLGGAGLAYGARIMPIRVLDANGAGTYADIADAIRFAADNGAKVINMSLGGPSPASYLEEAINYAYSKGVTIVAAAGNSSMGMVGYPAAYDKVIAVGATRYDETKAPYSNYGSALDIVAPGGDMGVDQNGDGYGDGILQQTFSGSTNNFGYYLYQGTSMATPHVAAAAALVISAGVASSPSAVRDRLTSTADDLGTAGRDNTYGYGLLNLKAAVGGEEGAETTPDPVPQTENHAPKITSNPPTSATEGSLYTYNVGASDEDGDPLSYSLGTKPSGMSINSSGKITWTPAQGQAGNHNVTVVVSDGELSDSQNFTISVASWIDAYIPRNIRSILRGR